jgi:hypothetical protein
MGIRKNAKFLTSTERENFVRACVMLKADIVNPAAPASGNTANGTNMLRSIRRFKMRSLQGLRR